MDIDWYWQKTKQVIKSFFDWKFLKEVSIKELWQNSKLTLLVLFFTISLVVFCEVVMISTTGMNWFLIPGTLYLYIYLKVNLSDNIKQYLSLKTFIASKNDKQQEK
jgi:hypothetical protein